MTQEEKRLLLVELCTRLPYGVKVYNTSFAEPQIQTLFGRIDDDVFIMKETYKSVSFSVDEFGASCEKRYTGYLEFIKPYLRPMSSITEEEHKIIDNISNKGKGFEEDENGWIRCDSIHTKWGVWPDGCAKLLDYLNSIHVDYRGLIPMGLALEAKEGMYKTV